MTTLLFFILSYQLFALYALEHEPVPFTPEATLQPTSSTCVNRTRNPQAHVVQRINIHQARKDSTPKTRLAPLLRPQEPGTCAVDLPNADTRNPRRVSLHATYDEGFCTGIHLHHQGPVTLRRLESSRWGRTAAKPFVPQVALDGQPASSVIVQYK